MRRPPSSHLGFARSGVRSMECAFPRPALLRKLCRPPDEPGRRLPHADGGVDAKLPGIHRVQKFPGLSAQGSRTDPTVGPLLAPAPLVEVPAPNAPPAAECPALVNYKKGEI